MPTPIIATFYSFRGGVGRTMALLNAGWVLARTGSRVLLVDFDLEAPGLTRLIARQDLFAGAAASVPGIADIIVQLLDTPDEWAFHADKPLPIDLSPFLRELKLPEPKFDWLPRGRLALISAGAEQDYERHLARIHTGQFTRLHEGFAARFREVLLKSGQFDYILIDARTGFSDEAYIAARYLCDRLVVLSGLNDQNIEGTGRFLSKVAAWSEKEPRPRNIILIASPVPEHEEELKAQRFARAKTRLAELSGSKPDFALQLPYHPRLALYEELIVERFPGSSLDRAYQQLAEMLRGAAQDSYWDWAQRAAEAIGSKDVDLATSLLFHVGRLAERRGRYGSARATFEQALAISQDVRENRATWHARFCIAELACLRCQYGEARRGLNESLAAFLEQSDLMWIGNTRHALAELDLLEGRYAEARQQLEELSPIYPQVLDRPGHVLYELHLQITRALESAGSDLLALRAAVSAARQCPDSYVAALSYEWLAEVLQQRGELGEARRELSAGIEFAEGHGLLGIAAEMRAERALAAADAGEPAQAAADARAAIAFFDAESVAHPHLARLRELAALPDAPQE